MPGRPRRAFLHFGSCGLLPFFRDFLRQLAQPQQGCDPPELVIRQIADRVGQWIAHAALPLCSPELTATS